MYVGEIPRYLLNQPSSELEKNHSLKKMLGLGLRKDLMFKKFQNISMYGILYRNCTLNSILLSIRQ